MARTACILHAVSWLRRAHSAYAGCPAVPLVPLSVPLFTWCPSCPSFCPSFRYFSKMSLFSEILGVVSNNFEMVRNYALKKGQKNSRLRRAFPPLGFIITGNGPMQHCAPEIDPFLAKKDKVLLKNVPLFAKKCPSCPSFCPSFHFWVPLDTLLYSTQLFSLCVRKTENIKYSFNSGMDWK